MASFEDIKGKVEQNGNALTVTMEELREAAGAGKLGIHVRAQISSALAGVGLGHVPPELPNYQHEQVRLYKRGTPIAQLIETALTPSDTNDKKLIEHIGVQGPDYASIVGKIRELVSD
jgi:hypothetical protein